MQEKILRFLFSNKLMAFLFIAFPTAMGVGTFLETFYSTTAAKIWIYNARWFEVIMLLLMLNFIGNIFKYKLLRKEKWAHFANGGQIWQIGPGAPRARVT